MGVVFVPLEEPVNAALWLFTKGVTELRPGPLWVLSH